MTVKTILESVLRFRSLSSKREKITIEFVNVVDQRLEPGPAIVLANQNTGLVGLPLIIFEDENEGREDEGLDYGEGTIGPAPARSLNKGIGGKRTGKGTADERRCGEAKSKGSVAQTGRISNENLQNEVYSIVTDPVEDIASSEGIGAIACRENDQPKNVDDDEDDQAFSTSPDSKKLSNG